MPYLPESKLNEIRGKVLVCGAQVQEILAVFSHLDTLEDRLEALDPEDFFGTEGWRHFLGLPEEDR